MSPTHCKIIMHTKIRFFANIGGIWDLRNTIFLLKKEMQKSFAYNYERSRTRDDFKGLLSIK